MKWIVPLLVVVVFAGCAEDAEPVIQETSEEVSMPKQPFTFSDSGSMENGAGVVVPFGVLENATYLLVEVLVTPFQGVAAFSQNAIASLVHDGDFVKAGGGQTVSFNNGPDAILHHEVRTGTNATMLQGNWELRFAADPSLAEYEIRIEVRY